MGVLYIFSGIGGGLLGLVLGFFWEFNNFGLFVAYVLGGMMFVTLLALLKGLVPR